MNRFLVCSLIFSTLAAATPASPQDTEAGDPSLDIRITPPQDSEETLERLGQLLEAGKKSGEAYATIAISYAEQAFDAGDYGRAEVEIDAAKRRIEAADPEAWLALAALDDAGARVDRAQGDLYHWVRKAESAADNIARALGPDHPASLIARIRASGAYFDAAAGEAPLVTLDSPRGAELMPTGYEIAARRKAEQALVHARSVLGERHRVALMAELNLASFNMAAGEHEEAEERLRAILNAVDPVSAGHADLARGAAQMLAGILARTGRSDEAEDVLARHADGDTLVRIDSADARLRRASASPFTARSTFTPDERTTAAGNFVDISFCIGPSGDVTDAAIINAKGSLRWQAEVLDAIRSRRYLPSAALGEHCTPQFERIAVAARSIPGRRSRIRRRAAEVYIVSTDLLEGGSLSSGILDESPRRLIEDENPASISVRD